jgi:RNA ligase (TIGR02306 family)
MSETSTEWQVRVARITNVRPHPNADQLDLADVEGYSVIVRRGEFAEGSLCVYIPRDSVVPEGSPMFGFLGSDRRIRPKRLRGIFSDGLVMPVACSSWVEGQDVGSDLGIVRYEPKLSPMLLSGAALPDPGIAPSYDLHPLRRYKDAFRDGDQAVITEKIHGTNARFALDEEGRFWAGSRNLWKRESDDDLWWRVARQYNMPEVLETLHTMMHVPNTARRVVVLYGEVYGPNIQKGFGYGVTHGTLQFRAFDLMLGPAHTRDFLAWNELELATEEVGIDVVPALYRGPFSMECVRRHAEGVTSLHGGTNVREGVVVRLADARVPSWWEDEYRDPQWVRWVLKYHGEGYLLKNGG